MTTTTPFQPKASDGIAQWERLYGYFQGLPHGHVATYDEVLAATEIDLRINRMPIYKCIQQLEENDKKTLESVHSVGYKVAQPNEHELLARRHHRSARRQLAKSVRKARSANRSLLTATERQRIDDIEVTLSRHADAIRRLDGRVKAVEKAQKQVKEETEAKYGEVSDTVRRMREALARKGIEIDDPE
jgi:hypothetical protein